MFGKSSDVTRSKDHLCSFSFSGSLVSSWKARSDETKNDTILGVSLSPNLCIL